MSLNVVTVRGLNILLLEVFPKEIIENVHNNLFKDVLCSVVYNNKTLGAPYMTSERTS